MVFENGLTNALVESFNTRIRLITRRTFGFHNLNVLVVLARLTFSGQRSAVSVQNYPLVRRADSCMRQHAT
jgi:hypothetical protein